MIGSGTLRTTNGENWPANERQLLTCLYGRSRLMPDALNASARAMGKNSFHGK